MFSKVKQFFKDVWEVVKDWYHNIDYYVTHGFHMPSPSANTPPPPPTPPPAVEPPAASEAPAPAPATSPTPTSDPEPANEPAPPPEAASAGAFKAAPKGRGTKKS